MHQVIVASVVTTHPDLDSRQTYQHKRYFLTRKEARKWIDHCMYAARAQGWALDGFKIHDEMLADIYDIMPGGCFYREYQDSIRADWARD